MAIEVKHAGNAAPFAAGAFAGSAKRGVPQMQIPAWGGGSSASTASRRGRSKKTYNELLEEGLTTRQAETTATKAGFKGPTPVRGINLDGTIDLTPQEIAANAMKASGAFGGGSGGKYSRIDTTKPRTIYDENGNLVKTFNGSGAAPVDTTAEPSYLDKARLERSEYDYKQRMDRSKMDYENRYQPEIERTYGEEEQAQLDNLNKRYSDAVNSGAHTPQDLAKIKEYVEAQKANIIPREKFKQSDMTPSGHKLGVPYLLGKSYVVESADGKTTKISDAADDPAEVQAKEHAKEQASEAKARDAERRKFFIEASKEMVTDPKGEKPPRRRTPEEMSAYMKAYDDANSAYDNPEAAIPTNGVVVDEAGNTTWEGDRGLAQKAIDDTLHTLRGISGTKMSNAQRDFLSKGSDVIYSDAEKLSKETGITIQDIIAATRKDLLK